MYRIQYQYFNQRGTQKTKVIEKTTLKALVSAMRRHLQNNELYEISHVSPNLRDYKFTQHGEEFRGYR